MTLFDLQFENKFLTNNLSEENPSKNNILLKRILEKIKRLRIMDSKLDGIIFKIRLGSFVWNKTLITNSYYFKPSVSRENFNKLFHNYMTNTNLTYTTENTIAYTCGQDKVYWDGNDVCVFSTNSLTKYDVKTNKKQYDFRVDISFRNIRKASLDLKLIEDTAFMRKKSKTIFIDSKNPYIRTNFLIVENRHKTGHFERTFEVELELLVGNKTMEMRGLVVNAFIMLQSILDVGK